MTKEQLGQMSIGKGFDRLLSFQAKLPTALDPSVSRLHASDPSWDYLVKFTCESVAAARSGHGRDLQAFITGIMPSAKQRCPDKVSNHHSEFAIGVMLGYFGRQSSS